ncbi:DNA-processing protein DprA [uncultured Muribaculum sp.]|nr:DNA-processing protein DprA [uncultured Muribaculum sp.]
MDNNTAYRIAFSRIKGINPSVAARILEHIGTEKEFFTLPAREIGTCLPQLPPALIADSYRRGLLDTAREEQEFMEKSHIRALYFTDDGYPARLAECEDAPLLLYTLGDTGLNAARMVSIVGTRRSTPYGMAFVENLVAELAEKLGPGTVIVSGLAYGIDVTAHRAALKAGLPTVAVLAHGLNTLYPAAHRSVAADMLRAGGMLLTEYASKDPLHKGNFIARNRIVAGVADCVVVAESARRGGALATASLAMSYSRDVMALPGRISDTYSQGCNDLIARNQAALITCADELIAAMGWQPIAARADAETQPALSLLTPDEERIVDYLHEQGEGSLNKMCVDLSIPVAQLTGLLMSLEFGGHIITYPGAKYRPAR